MDSMKYPHVWAAIMADVWAILPSKMAEITEFMAYKSIGRHITIEEARDRFGDSRDRKPAKSGGGIGVMPVYGTISQRAGLLQEASGGASVDQLTAQFRDFMADDSIHTIVLDIDSPGGSVAGLTEFANEIYKARRTKPVIAVANSLMASAAYWIASSASEIVASPSSKVGAIGVIAAHENQQSAMEKLGIDVSLITAGKYKAENNPFEPLTKEGRAEIQRRVDESYGMFTRDIARGRGIPVQAVRDGFGEGRIFGAKDAVRMGMADRVATLEEVLATANKSNQAGDSALANRALVAGSYEDRVRLVAADMASLVEATRDRIRYRMVDERGIGSANEATIAGILESAGRLEALLRADPPTERLNPLALTGLRSAALVLAGIEGD